MFLNNLLVQLFPVKGQFFENHNGWYCLYILSSTNSCIFIKFCFELPVIGREKGNENGV